MEYCLFVFIFCRYLTKSFETNLGPVVSSLAKLTMEIIVEPIVSIAFIFHINLSRDVKTSPYSYTFYNLSELFYNTQLNILFYFSMFLKGKH